MKGNFLKINRELISYATGVQESAELKEVQVLDLHLRNNEGKIRHIENLDIVPNLIQLNLSYNAITEIIGLDLLSNLVELNLAENSITAIENLTNLRKLQKLNLSGNFIERIPESINELSALTHFRIARNRLCVIEDVRNLAPLANLTNLRVEDNPFCNNPALMTEILASAERLKFLDGKEVGQIVKATKTDVSYFNPSNFSVLQQTAKTEKEEQVSFIASDKVLELNKRIEKLTHKLLAYEYERQLLLTKCEELSVEKETVKKELYQSDENLDRALVALQSANADFNSMQESIALVELENEKKISQLQKQNQLLIEERSQLQMKLHEFQDKTRNIDYRDQERIDKLKERLATVVEESQILKNQLNQGEVLNRSLQDRKNELEEDAAALKAETKHAKHCIDLLRGDLSQVQSQVKTLTRENIKLKSELNDTKSNEATQSNIWFKKIDGENEEVFGVKIKDDFNKLEKAAAEIIASLIVEEMRKYVSASSQIDALRCSSVQIAFRIVSAIGSLTHQESTDGSDSRGVSNSASGKLFSKLVEDAIVGLKTFEDSISLKQEIQQLQKLQIDIEHQIEARGLQLKEKENLLKRMQQQSLECRRQAEDTLLELETLNLRLQTGRDELLKVDSELHLYKREIEITRNNLKESCALNEIENKSVAALRDRIATLKYEQSELEDANLNLRDLNLKEESKLRSVKSMSSEQIRLIQLDLSKLNQEFRNKKGIIDDFDKQRQVLEDESLLRRRELENNLTLLVRQSEEESRRLAIIRNDVRLSYNDLEQIRTKRKQKDQEMQLLQEKVEEEKIRFDSAENEFKRKIEQYERHLQDLENKILVAKEMLAASKKEQSSLSQQTEEQRRLLQDLAQSLLTKRKQMETELSEIENRSQSAEITLRQLSEQQMTKQLEFQSLVTEIRIHERRLEEVKKLVRIEELKLNDLNLESKSLENSKIAVLRDITNLKSQSDEIRLSCHSQKAVLFDTSKLLDEKKLLIERMSVEEHNFREMESRAKQSMLVLQSQKNETQNEIRILESKVEQDRRMLQDLQNTKQNLEREITFMKDQLEKLKELANSKSVARQETDASLSKSREELSSLQQQTFHVRAELQELKIKGEEIRALESSVKANYQRLVTELDGLRQSRELEEATLVKAKADTRDLLSSNQKLKQSLQSLHEELQNKKIELSDIINKQQLSEALKQSCESEIHRLKEQQEIEAKKYDSIERKSTEILQRLQKLKDEMIILEESCESKRALSLEESKKVEHQKKLLQKTAEDIVELENSVKRSNLQLEQLRQKELLEIGQLKNLKHTAQSQYLHLLVARDKMEIPRNHSSQFVVPKRVEFYDVVQSNPYSSQLSPRSQTGKIGTVFDKENDDQNLSFTSAVDANSEEYEKLAFSSLQQAVEKLRSQSKSVIEATSSFNA